MTVDRGKMNTMACAVAGVMITWYISHRMGYGPIIANGMVGVVAAALLPAPLAGATYTASFVGMSGLNVLPTLFSSLLGGIVVGLILVFTPEIYAGIGGKGGTAAALAAHITRGIMSLFR